MAWEHDQPPLEYLKRRVKYYKKRRGTTRNLIKSEFMVKKYGRKNLLNGIAAVIAKIEARITEFEEAIKKLEK